MTTACSSCAWTACRGSDVSLLSPTLRTRFTPPVRLDLGAGGEQGIVGELAVAIVQPEVELAGVVYAPAGRPGEQWKVAAAVAAVVVGLALWRLLRRK